MCTALPGKFVDVPFPTPLIGPANIVFNFPHELKAEMSTLVPKRTCGVQDEFNMKYTDDEEISWNNEDETWILPDIQAAEVDDDDADRMSDASTPTSPSSALAAALLNARLPRTSDARASSSPPTSAGES